MRTCIGCRKSGSVSELFRVVADARVTRPDGVSESSSNAVVVAVDDQRKASGRGAWLHLSLKCLEFARKKHAFSRALKVQGEIDCSAVDAYVGSHVTLGKKI